MTIMLAREIAQLVHNAGIGVFSTATPADRTIYVGELPQDITEGMFIIEVPSPPPHQYIDTEYPILDFWYRSPYTDLAHEKLEQVYALFHRKHHYTTANWSIALSRALGTIVDVDREQESGKLFRLSVQFICRNLNNIS